MWAEWKAELFLSDPSTPAAAHKGGWAHPTSSGHLRQSTGAWQVRKKGPGHGTLRHGRWGGHQQAEPALLQGLLREELSLSQGQLFIKKYTLFLSGRRTPCIVLPHAGSLGPSSTQSQEAELGHPGPSSCSTPRLSALPCGATQLSSSSSGQPRFWSDGCTELLEVPQVFLLSRQ